MHPKIARKAVETDDRLCSVAAWREGDRIAGVEAIADGERIGEFDVELLDA